MLIFERTPAGRNALFWVLQVGGWTAYWLVQFFSAVFWGKPAGSYQVIAVLVASGFLITTPFRLVYRRLWGRPLWVMILGSLATVFIAAMLWHAIIDWAFLEVMGRAMHADQSVIGFMLTSANTSFELLSWTGLYFGYKYYDSLRLERELTLRAEALAQEAQVKMLRYQLNPHVLFNTLNAISTLILANENRKANQAVMRMSEFLRYSLDQDPMKMVTLRQEIAALNLYLSTERLRFGERLAVEFAVEEEAFEGRLPSLLLQPLIENAVKYAIAPSEEGGRIRVEGRVRAGMLEIAVEDEGPGLDGLAALSSGRGVGLRNARERLAALYGAQHRFAALDAQPGLRIEIGIPLQTEAMP